MIDEQTVKFKLDEFRSAREHLLNSLRAIPFHDAQYRRINMIIQDIEDMIIGK